MYNQVLKTPEVRPSKFPLFRPTLRQPLSAHTVYSSLAIWKLHLQSLLPPIQSSNRCQTCQKIGFWDMPTIKHTNKTCKPAATATHLCLPAPCTYSCPSPLLAVFFFLCLSVLASWLRFLLPALRLAANLLFILLSLAIWLVRVLPQNRPHSPPPLTGSAPLLYMECGENA